MMIGCRSDISFDETCNTHADFCTKKSNFIQALNKLLVGEELTDSELTILNMNLDSLDNEAYRMLQDQVLLKRVKNEGSIIRKRRK